MSEKIGFWEVELFWFKWTYNRDTGQVVLRRCENGNGIRERICEICQ
jgi:hypothetical protein